MPKAMLVIGLILPARRKQPIAAKSINRCVRAGSEYSFPMGLQANTELHIGIGPLGAYLETCIDGFEGLQSCQQLATDQSNPTYRLLADSGPYVLRAKPPGVLLKLAHIVERDFRVMVALANSAVPLPGMLHLAAGEHSPLGRSFFVMEFLEGRFFWDPALADLDRADLGLPSEDAYVASYLDRRGLADLNNWPFYLAFSFFRLAAILQGVAQRSRDGNPGNPGQGAKYGAAVPILARLALDLIGK